MTTPTLPTESAATTPSMKPVVRAMSMTVLGTVVTGRPKSFAARLSMATLSTSFWGSIVTIELTCVGWKSMIRSAAFSGVRSRSASGSG